MNQIAPIQKRSLVDSMAARYDMEPTAFVAAIKATVIKGDCSNEQFAAFLMVAKEYDLNPLTKEIYAFPDRGGIQPIVSIDGWMNLINSHPQFDGMEFQDTHDDGGKLYSVECRMYRKDRTRHVSVIEYMSECFRQTDPWKKWPNRMLRHKAAIQCARYAFGFSGIMEPDEYDRMKDVTPADNKPAILERLASNQITEYDEGFDAANVTRETDSLSSVSTNQNTDTSDLAPADVGGDTSHTSSHVAPNLDTAQAEQGEGAAMESSAGAAPTLDADTDHDFDEDEWLKTFARVVVAAIGPDESVVVDASKGQFVDGLSKDASERAKTIINYARQACRGEIEPDDAKEIIAGKAKTEVRDIL